METEALFWPYEHDPRYAHIFSYKKRILTVLKQLRVSSRPQVLAVSSATDLARHTSATGESIGYSYPTKPGEVPLRGPTMVLNFLTPLDAKLLQLPYIMDPSDGNDDLSNNQRAAVQANHNINMTARQEYHKNVSGLFTTFYDGVPQASLRLDNCLQFSSEMLSHVDDSLLDLARNKLLSLFKG